MRENAGIISDNKDWLKRNCRLPKEILVDSINRLCVDIIIITELLVIARA